MQATKSARRRIATIGTAGLVTIAAVATAVISALPASAATLCDQFATVVAGNYVIMNNRWGTSATQCINTTSNGFSITQQDGVGNTSGAPTAYPAIYLGCHYTNCSPNSPLPRQLSTIGSAPSSISYSYPGSGTYNAAYDIWLNADTNVSGVQDTGIMIWFNRQGNIQPIGSATGTVSIAGRSWQVWTGSNGQNNVVSYLFQGSVINSLSFDVMDFVRDVFTRGSQYGTNSWYLTSVQAGFEPWIGGVGLTVNSFSSAVNGGTQQNPQVPGTPGTPSASNVTNNSVSLNWGASSGTVSNYQIERCQNTNCTNFSQVGTSTSTSFTNSGLSANTAYRYRVRATNSAGNSGYSGILSVTTTNTSTPQVPGTPGTPAASNITASSLSLNWSASSGTVSSYLIERATGASSTSFSQVGSTGGTSFNDSGLAANTTYRYRVRAQNSAGTSGYSNITNATTTSGGGGGGCSAVLTLQTGWNNGYVIQPATVTNTGSSTINGWTVTFTLPSGHTITNSWNATVTVSGSTVTARGISGQNATLGAGQNTAFGFQATRPNGNTQVPSGATCTSP